jgi:phosphoribosylglycinamide formyltransferase 1
MPLGKAAHPDRINRDMKNIGVLVSGRGSNLQAIMDSCDAGRLDARVAVVISDVEDAYGLERARKAGIKAIYIPWVKGKKSEWESQAVRHLQNESCDLVCLAGYMRVCGSTLLDAFPYRVLNIHPALCPSFPGLHAQEQAYNWGVKVTGCTVHFVTSDLDMGPIIVQREVRVLESDTADTLSARILEQEHEAFTEAIGLVLDGRTEIDGRRVKILPEKIQGGK